MKESAHATQIERFAVLHDAAEALLDQLFQRHMVERRETKEQVGAAEAPVRTVRLIPRTPAAAPLAVAFTDFPGLSVRLGRWWAQPLPTCACDECNEDPAQLIEVLGTQAAALAEGGLWERVRRGVGGSWFETRLIGVGIHDGHAGPLSRQDARDARRGGFAAPVRWAPWPRRS